MECCDKRRKNAADVLAKAHGHHITQEEALELLESYLLTRDAFFELVRYVNGNRQLRRDMKANGAWEYFRRLYYDWEKVVTNKLWCVPYSGDPDPFFDMKDHHSYLNGFLMDIDGAAGKLCKDYTKKSMSYRVIRMGYGYSQLFGGKI